MRYRALLALLPLLASACAVGPNYVAPELPVPGTYAGPQAPPGAEIDAAHWWTSFNDPVLTSLVTRALADSPSMAIAAARIREARAQEIAARSRGLPQINASANATDVRFSKNAGLSQLARAFGGGGSSSGSSGSSAGGIALPGDSIRTYAAGFDASWEIDVFGGVRRGVEAARARGEAAEWSARDAGVSLSSEVAQAYFAWRFDQQQAAIVRDELARQQRGLEIAGHVSQVGLVAQVDVTRQRAGLTATEARLAPIEADVAVRRHALALLIGQAPEALDAELTTASVEPSLPVIPAGLPSDLLRRRPDVRAAERNLAAATADVGVAVADLYPKFSLTGMAQFISTALGNLFTGDSLQLTGSGAAQFPLFDWGRRKSTVNVRKAQRDEAYQQYRQAVLGALRDVEDALVRLDAERQRNATLRGGVNDAEATARAVEAQYKTGLVAQDSLLNAQSSALQARENLAQSDAQLRQMTISLFKAIGGGWEEAPPVAAKP